jgi:hypothetical protein
VPVGDRAALGDQRDLLDLLGRREALELRALEGDQVELADGRQAEQGEEAREQEADAPLDEAGGRETACRPRARQGTVAPTGGWTVSAVVGAGVVTCVSAAVPAAPVAPWAPVGPATAATGA